MTEFPQKKSENIFEAVSEFEKKLHEKERTERAEPEQAPDPLQALFQQCLKMHEQLSARIDREFERFGITESQYRAYVNRPQNFSAKDWKRLQEQKASTEAKLQRLIPHAIIPKTQRPMPPEPAKGPSTQEPTPQKPRPGPKRRPITKRGWLEMR